MVIMNIQGDCIIFTLLLFVVLVMCVYHLSLKLVHNDFIDNIGITLFGSAAIKSSDNEK